MSRFRMTREQYVSLYLPSNVRIVRARHSDAVAYIYEYEDGTPCAAFFVGKRGRPEKRHSFKTAAGREYWLRTMFDRRQRRAEEKAAREQEKREAGRGVEVGHVLCASWGYDQTNVNFFQVVKLIGKTMAEIREIGQHEVSDGPRSMTGRTMPDIDNFIGKPKRVRISEGRCRIDCMHLHVWEGRPEYCSSYA